MSFSEALTVFDDILAKIFCDSDRSEDEAREIIIGRSLTGTLPLVSFTERAPDRVLRVGRSTRQAGVFVTVG